MRYTVDEAMCCAHGRCAVEAPEVYDLDDNGFNTAIGQDIVVEPGCEEAAQLGADSCPEAAIRIFFT